MHTRAAVRRGLGVVAALLVQGCQLSQETKVALERLEPVSEALVAALPKERMKLNITGRQITVTLVNSVLEQLPDEERAARTRAIAQLVRETYPEPAALSVVSVAFMTEGGTGPITVWKTQATNYSMLDLTPPLGAAPAAVASPEADSAAPDTVAPRKVRWNDPLH